MLRLQFLPGEQSEFLKIVYKRSHRSTDQLAEIVGVHPRTLRDWRREKLRISLAAARLFCQKFEMQLPEVEDVMIQRWKVSQRLENRIGGLATFKRYGIFATQEGREKGGKNSWLKRQENSSFWRKYTLVMRRPDESEMLAEFIGIMLGDGGLTQGQCKVYLNSEVDTMFAKYLGGLIFQLFNIRPSITKRKDEKLLRVSVSSVDLVEYLIQKGLQIGDKVHLQVGVPTWIWSKPGYIKACIRGLLDTDGCFVIHRYRVKGKEYIYPKISFCNRSLPILEFMQRGLEFLGYTPKRSFDKYVWLYNQKEVKRYLEEIGTKNYKPAVRKILEGC